MENLRTLTLIVTLAVLCPGAVFAYSRETHQGLADVTLRAYEQLRGNSFADSEKTALIQGTWDEDDDWRFMRHFFDPVNNRGLFGENVASKYWAQDTEGQGNYNCLNAWLCAGKHISYNDKFFSSPTDFSWDRAVYEYAWGDSVKGAAALGHVLHLIQDATVPAHVRDDAHPSKWGIDIQADPYETYSARYTQNSTTLPASLSLSSVPGLAHAFDAVASFTNKNFVSKDTLTGSFSSPDLEKILVRDGYGHSVLGFKVARIEIRKDFKGHEIERRIFIDDEKDSVAADYWQVLSKKAIETSIGVIDLFFREVEKEKKTGALKARNVSAAELHAKETAQKGFGIVKKFYGSSLEQSDVEDLLNDNARQAGAAALAVSVPPSPPKPNPASLKPAVPKTSEPQPKTEPQVLGVSVSPPEEQLPEQTPPVPSTPVVPQENVPPPSASNSGSPSGGSPTQVTETSSGGGGSPSPSLPALSLEILSPEENASFATTSVNFAGTTSDTSVVTAAYDSVIATTTADGGGNWSFDFVLSAGTTTVSFSAATSAESTATSTRTVVVDTTPPDAPDISISECSASFIIANCTVATTTVTIAWSSVSGAAYYEVIKNNVALATTTATSTASNINSAATTTFSVVAYKQNGLAATSTEKTVFVTTQPLIINEIAWAGTNASAEDEAIELRNMTNSIIDLSHFVITTPDGSRTIPLSGTIAASGDTSAHDFFVVERSAEATTAALPNALTENFTQLSDGGEQLLLQWGDGVSTTTIDTTPAVATCSGWCAGASTGSAGYSVQSGTTTAQLTMERKDNSSDGSLAASWHTADGYTLGAFDRTSSVIYGTLGANNSKGNPNAGWFCSPDTVSISSDSHYTPPSSTCTYLMRAISTQARRYAAVYRGDVGSSTIVAGNSFGKVYIKENQPVVISDPQPGEHFFVAIYEGRVGAAFDPPADDNSRFDAYFRTGGTPPHSNYFVIPWIYGP